MSGPDDGATLAAVRDALAEHLVGEGGIETDHDDVLLYEIDALIARYGRGPIGANVRSLIRFPARANALPMVPPRLTTPGWSMNVLPSFEIDFAVVVTTRLIMISGGLREMMC